MAGTSPAMTVGGRFVKAIVIALATAAFVSPASAQTLPGGFVFLRDIDPTIIQDIRYAGSNNFVGRPLRGYEAAECVVKREVALALKTRPAGTRAAKPVAENVRLLPAGAGGGRHGRLGAATAVRRRPEDGTIRRSARRICSGWVTSPSIPAIPPAPRSTSLWSI